MIHLETERLLVRDWVDDDFESFAALNADARVMEHFPAVSSRDRSDMFAKRIQLDLDRNGVGFYAVEVKATSRFIGFIGLSSIGFQAAFSPAVQVGWRLAFGAWGQGYASEAAKACFAHGFGELGLDEIVSFTTRRNERSIAVMERIGMTRDPEGDFECPQFPVGRV
jgi:RimJ/RimL family protein N-acetyltransferase